MFLRRYINETALIGITAAVVSMVVLFNDVNIQIWIKEIKVFLHRSNRNDNNIDHIGLVMQYKHHKDMYDNRISDANASLVETRVSSILSKGEEKTGKISEKYGYLSVPVLFSINIIRYLIGLPVIQNAKEDELNLNLEVAYYYERNKNYIKAIDFYDQILGENLSGRALKASILLHQGFCYSIIGDYKNAKAGYLTVIKDYGDLNVAATAAMMLSYLEEFRIEIERIMKTEKDSPEKGEKLFNLIAYNQSLDVLNRIEKTASPAEKKKINFFKGRSLEASGESAKALEIYQQIILDDPKSLYAISANRRIYLVGSLLFDGGKIKNLSLENNKLINDNTLLEMVDEESKFLKEEKNTIEDTDNENDRNSFMKKISAVNVNAAVESGYIDRMMKKVEEKIIEKNKITKPDNGENVTLKVLSNDGTMSWDKWLNKNLNQKKK